MDTGGAGSIVIYTGAEPALANDAAGTEVATCALAATAYAAAAADAVNSWADANLAATATDTSATGNASAVTYFRILNGAVHHSTPGHHWHHGLRPQPELNSHSSHGQGRCDRPRNPRGLQRRVDKALPWR